MFIKNVILSALGTCKLFNLLLTYCFSSWQNKNQVCCLWEQEEKNGKLKTLKQRVKLLGQPGVQLVPEL
ncbi:THAP domain-containing protein 4 [Camelus dromedarius]|uniref:THAP domain-containing protein 4 n=1 Tax=Camelus dromedarius TaxID=9838 RepID=A0A5N4D2I8_CAMDR|nr:THAP domain-containing protein 4 [Camelus dromedarius]